MKKIAFIIPGFGFSGKEKEYQEIAEFFKEKNIEASIVEIEWKRRVHSQYVEQAFEQIQKQSDKNDEICLLGFSFGAMIALDLASKMKLKNLILCSLSPFFREDMSQIKQWWKNYHGKKRCTEFEKLSFANLARKINCKAFILAGDKEGIEVECRAKDAHKKIAKSELVFLGGVKHDISDERYLGKIGKIISQL